MILNGAVATFGLDEGGLVLALTRGVSVAALLSLFGALLFATIVAPTALASAAQGERIALQRTLCRWIWLGIMAAVLCLLLWLPLQSAEIAGAETLSDSLSAVPTVLMETRYGHLVMLQLAGLLAVGVAWGQQWRAVATVLSALTLALHAGHGHAASMEPLSPQLLVSDVLHLLAAGGWLGALLPLLLMVRGASPRVGAAMCRFYSPLGKWCVVLLLGSAVIQFSELIGGAPGLVGTAYGWVALGKMTLFAVLFGFACVNRYWLAPALLGPKPEPSRGVLVRSIGWQSVAGLAVVLAAGVLSQLPPAMHTQPVWPFTEQFSLVSLTEDADLRDEVLWAVGALALAAVIACGGLRWRRRWFGVALICAAILLAASQREHLTLLFVPAMPESFYTSPTGFSAESISAGGRLYPQNCASCHGADGHGDGPLAKSLPIPPADLTAPHLWAHSDGELFGWIAHGIQNPEGGLAMPGFAEQLSEDDIWALIDFIRARNPATPHDSQGRPMRPPEQMTMHHEM